MTVSSYTVLLCFTNRSRRPRLDNLLGSYDDGPSTSNESGNNGDGPSTVNKKKK